MFNRSNLDLVNRNAIKGIKEMDLLNESQFAELIKGGEYQVFSLEGLNKYRIALFDKAKKSSFEEGQKLIEKSQNEFNTLILKTLVKDDGTQLNYYLRPILKKGEDEESEFNPMNHSDFNNKKDKKQEEEPEPGNEEEELSEEEMTVLSTISTLLNKENSTVDFVTIGDNSKLDVSEVEGICKSLQDKGLITIEGNSVTEITEEGEAISIPSGEEGNENEEEEEEEEEEPSEDTPPSNNEPENSPTEENEDNPTPPSEGTPPTEKEGDMPPSDDKEDTPPSNDEEEPKDNYSEEELKKHASEATDEELQDVIENSDDANLKTAAQQELDSRASSNTPPTKEGEDKSEGDMPTDDAPKEPIIIDTDKLPMSNKEEEPENNNSEPEPEPENNEPEQEEEEEPNPQDPGAEKEGENITSQEEEEEFKKWINTNFDNQDTHDLIDYVSELVMQSPSKTKDLKNHYREDYRGKNKGNTIDKVPNEDFKEWLSDSYFKVFSPGDLKDYALKLIEVNPSAFSDLKKKYGDLKSNNMLS